ncbi:MAG: hypothetical protein HGA22_02800 [Clostridiales bacterium]|nr:hypothetical protein [Clostridiales bacterium]
MNNLFGSRTTLKVMSVLIAIFIWIFVLNTSNPYETATFKSIPLKVENESFLDENDYVLKNNYKTSIDITVRGRHDSISQVKDSDFSASIDFSKIKSADDSSLAINGPFCSAKDISIVSYNPEKIDIVLSRIKGNSFPLELSSDITVKTGYKIVSVTPNIDSLTLEGEEALVNSVDKVVASISIKDLDKDVNKSVECKVLNKEGKEISSLSKGLTVEVAVKVAKAVSVSMTVEGSLNDNYAEVSRTVLPNVVYITGTAAVLSKITEIKTAAVSIQDATENITSKVPLVLPEGVKLADMENSVAVGIEIEPILTNTFEIAGSGITLINQALDGSAEYKVKSEKVEVTLKGRKSLLENISAASLSPSADVSGLSEGIHRVKLKLTLPSLVKLPEDAYAEIEVIKKIATVTPLQ